MRAGRLRHLVTIEEPTVTQNDYGETVESWATFAVVNAAIEPISAREFFSGNQIQADVTHRVTLRYLPGVTTAMRIVFGSRVLHIEYRFTVNERDAELQLLCKEAL